MNYLFKIRLIIYWITTLEHSDSRSAKTLAIYSYKLKEAFISVIKFDTEHIAHPCNYSLCHNYIL